MKNLFSVLLFVFSYFANSQYSDIIALNSIGVGQKIKASKIERDKRSKKIKTISEASNDSLAVELCSIINAHYWTNHLLLTQPGNEFSTIYKLDHDLVNTFIDEIFINDSEEPFFIINIENHRSWISNYEKGKTLEKGVLLFKVFDGTLYYQYFKKSIERSGTDYRTGTFHEDTRLLELKTDANFFQFIYPLEGIKKNYELIGNQLVLLR